MRHVLGFMPLLMLTAIASGQLTIREVSPATALPGEEITIRGMGLDDVGEVEFQAFVGGFTGLWKKRVPVVEATPRAVRVRTPLMAGFAPAGAAAPGKALGSLVLLGAGGAVSEKQPFTFEQAQCELVDAWGLLRVKGSSAAGRRVEFVPDGSKVGYLLRLPPTLSVSGGGRAWLRGGLRGENLRVTDLVAVGKKGAEKTPMATALGDLRVKLDRVYPWCDHMPVTGRQWGRQYLLVDLEITNGGTKPVELIFDPVFLSTESGRFGRRVDAVTLRGKDGAPSGRRTLRLKPGKHALQLRGDGIFEEGLHGKTLFVTVAVRQGAEVVLVRNKGRVEVTH